MAKFTIASRRIGSIESSEGICDPRPLFGKGPLGTSRGPEGWRVLVIGKALILNPDNRDKQMLDLGSAKSLAVVFGFLLVELYGAIE